jgi:hypothetical protein
MNAELSALSEIKPAGAIVTLDYEEIVLLNRALLQLSYYPEIQFPGNRKEVFAPKKASELARKFGCLMLEMKCAKRIEVL